MEAMAEITEAAANRFDVKTLNWSFDAAMQAFEVEFDVSD
jgi:hypothetical protein